MALNAEWHKAHPMPKKPTLEERIPWHEEHARECGCRAMPASIRDEIERRRNEQRRR